MYVCLILAKIYIHTYMWGHADFFIKSWCHGIQGVMQGLTARASENLCSSKFCEGSSIWWRSTQIVYIYLHKICHTAILIIIDARYHDFNGFPAVNWYYKPLKADNGRQLFWDWQYLHEICYTLIFIMIDFFSTKKNSRINSRSEMHRFEFCSKRFRTKMHKYSFFTLKKRQSLWKWEYLYEICWNTRPNFTKVFAWESCTGWYVCLP